MISHVLYNADYYVLCSNLNEHVSSIQELLLCSRLRLIVAPVKWVKCRSVNCRCLTVVRLSVPR